jgi:hypothetical protein
MDRYKVVKDGVVMATFSTKYHATKYAIAIEGIVEDCLQSPEDAEKLQEHVQ